MLLASKSSKYQSGFSIEMEYKIVAQETAKLPVVKISGLKDTNTLNEILRFEIQLHFFTSDSFATP